MSGYTCDCCGEPKNECIPHDSKLLPGTVFIMCRSCISSGFEPRWAIIVAGRSYGHERVRKTILSHRYLGEDITYKEIVK